MKWQSLLESSSSVRLNKSIEYFANFHDYLRYLLATLKAKEGKIIKTVVNKSFIKSSLNGESGVFGPPAVKTIQIPKIPKSIDAIMKIFVVIFCMFYILSYFTPWVEEYLNLITTYQLKYLILITK